jgi:hypothetical protein
MIRVVNSEGASLRSRSRPVATALDGGMADSWIATFIGMIFKLALAPSCNM